MDVSIVIPTKNGGHLFEKVLDAVFKQKTEYEYEVICVDSGSKDGTLDVIRKYPCRLFQIEPSEFGHGKTRNYGASKGNGNVYHLYYCRELLPATDTWRRISLSHEDGPGNRGRIRDSLSVSGLQSA